MVAVPQANHRPGRESTLDDGDHIDEIGEIDDGDSFVRPYTLTGGRTQSDGIFVAVEAAVCQTAGSILDPPALAPVETDIWLIAERRISSAEISALLELPLGVVRVLVGDLVAAGLVDLGETTAVADAQLVRRLIDGVRAL